MLKANGYRTFYAGKYLNTYYGSDIPEGYDSFYGLQGNSRYYNYKLNENGVINNYTTEYLTDVLVSLIILRFFFVENFVFQKLSR